MTDCSFCGAIGIDSVCGTAEAAIKQACPRLAQLLRYAAPKEPDDEFARRARQKDRLLALASVIALKTFEKDKEYGSSWKRVFVG